MSILSNWGEWRGLLPADEVAIKLCKDCRWCRYDRGSPDASVCENPTIARQGPIDYVTGKTARLRAGFCNIVRDDSRLCGPEARYFGRREPTNRPRKDRRLELASDRAGAIGCCVTIRGQAGAPQPGFECPSAGGRHLFWQSGGWSQ